MSLPSAQEVNKGPLLQILELLGLGSCGPPIPPPTLFSVISYPVKRLPPATTDIMKHFVFVNPPSDDLSLMDEKTEADIEADLLSAAITLKVRGQQRVPRTLPGLSAGRARSFPLRQPAAELLLRNPQQHPRTRLPRVSSVHLSDDDRMVAPSVTPRPRRF